MKCRNCGAELLPDVRICLECGCEVLPKRRYCRNCGAELSGKMKFCSSCGTKVVDADIVPTEIDERNSAGIPTPVSAVRESETKPAPESSDTQEANNGSPKVTASAQSADAPKTASHNPSPKDSREESDVPEKSSKHEASTASDEDHTGSGANKTQLSGLSEKALAIWSKLDTFSKILVVLAAPIAILTLIALLVGKTWPILISAVQIGALVCAFLIHKGTIQLNQKWVKYLLVGFAAVLIITNISGYSKGSSGGTSSGSRQISNQSNMPGNNEGSNIVAVTTTEEKTFELYLDLTSKTNAFFSKYDMEIFFDGTELGVVSNGELFTKLIEVTPGDHELCIYKSGDHGIKAKRTLTITKSTTFKATIAHESSSISFENTSFSDSLEGAKIEMLDAVGMVLADAVKQLKDSGFVNISYEGSSSIYDTDNWLVVGQNIAAGTESDKNDKIVLECIKLDQYYNDLLAGKTLPEAEKIAAEKCFSLTYRNANKHQDIQETIDALSDAEKELWTVESAAQSVKGYAAVYLTYNGTPNDNEAIVPITYYECSSKNYKEVVELFEDAGFTNISTKADYDIIWGVTEEESVDTITIDGEDSFYKGDILKKDAKIVIIYHMKAEDDPEEKEEDDEESSRSGRSVYYSTNDSEKAKDGNSGVFAYIRTGRNYDLYWIIDFDEGYAYYFSDGNGDSICERLKIDSGDLNEYVLMTNHDGDYTFQEALCFKWKRQPEHVLYQVNNDVFDYYATDLDDALEIRSTKTIKDH